MYDPKSYSQNIVTHKLIKLYIDSKTKVEHDPIIQFIVKYIFFQGASLSFHRNLSYLNEKNAKIKPVEINPFQFWAKTQNISPAEITRYTVSQINEKKEAKLNLNIHICICKQVLVSVFLINSNSISVGHYCPFLVCLLSPLSDNALCVFCI